MTLDEAIIHAEEAAKRNEEYAKIYAHGDEFEQEDAFKCENCAKEHRQFAEWLKDYKRLLEQEPCDDCISRQAVLEALNKMDRYVADELTLCGTERKFSKNEIFIVDDVYEEIVEQLSPVTPAEKAGRWIPVSERLPEKDDLYLIYFDDGEYDLVYFSKGFFDYSGIIAWMPLPEPYK